MVDYSASSTNCTTFSTIYYTTTTDSWYTNQPQNAWVHEEVVIPAGPTRWVDNTLPERAKKIASDKAAIRHFVGDFLPPPLQLPVPPAPHFSAKVRAWLVLIRT